MITQADFDALKLMVKKNEGVRNVVYRDSLRIPTIGVGFNLLRAGAQERLDEVGTSVTRLMNGEFLSDADVDWLFERDLKDAIADVRVLIPDLDSHPLAAQLVLIDLRFNMGPTKLRGFNGERGTLEAFRNRDYKRAAAKLKASLWAQQVGKRAERSVKLLESI